MKAPVLVFFVAILAFAAMVSRPNEASFKAWYGINAPVKKQSFFGKLFGRKSDPVPSDCVYKDHVLWADVERDGQVVYSGAFDRWIDRPIFTAKVSASDVAKAAR